MTANLTLPLRLNFPALTMGYGFQREQPSPPARRRHSQEVAAVMRPADCQYPRATSALPLPYVRRLARCQSNRSRVLRRYLNRAIQTRGSLHRDQLQQPRSVRRPVSRARSAGRAAPTGTGSRGAHSAPPAIPRYQGQSRPGSWGPPGHPLRCACTSWHEATHRMTAAR